MNCMLYIIVYYCSGLKFGVAMKYFVIVISLFLSIEAPGSAGAQEARTPAGSPIAELRSRAKALSDQAPPYFHELARSECRGPLRAAFEREVNGLIQLRNFLTSRAAQSSHGDPIFDLQIKEAMSVLNTADDMTSAAFLFAGNAALAGNCLDVAEEYFRLVQGYRISRFEDRIRMARLGIEDIRERQRRAEIKRQLDIEEKQKRESFRCAWLGFC